MHDYDHVDLIGLRAAGSVESIEEQGNAVASFLSTRICFSSHRKNIDPKNKWLGVAAEVKTNDRRDKINPVYLAYVRRFLGGAEAAGIVFSRLIAILRGAGITQKSATHMSLTGYSSVSAAWTSFSRTKRK